MIESQGVWNKRSEKESETNFETVGENGQRYTKIASIWRTLSYIIGISVLFALYEFLKTTLFATLTIWESHTISIMVVAALSALFATRFNRIYNQQNMELRAVNERLLNEIGERLQMEQAISEQLHFLQVLIDTTPTPIFYKDLKGVYQGCNKAWLDMNGLCREDMIGKTANDVYPGEQAEKFDEMDQELIDNSGIQVYEHKMRFADGTDHDVLLRKATYQDSARHLAGIAGIIIDVTERNQLEERMREQFFKTFNYSPSMMGIFTVEDDKHIDVNKSWCHYFGYQRSEAIGHTALEMGLWAYPEERARVVNKLLRGEDVNNYEMCYRTKAGEIRQGLFSPRVIELHGKRCILFVLNDITERKQAENELRLLEEKFSKAFNACPSPMAIITFPAGRFIDVNVTFLQVLGYQHEEIIGFTRSELRLWEKPADLTKAIEILRETCSIRSLETSFRTKSDQSRIGLVSAELFEIHGEVYMLGVFNDITERKMAEQALREREGNYGISLTTCWIW